MATNPFKIAQSSVCCTDSSFEKEPYMAKIRCVPQAPFQRSCLRSRLRIALQKNISDV